MPTLSFAHRVRATEAEGPHLRYAVWTRGCTIRCPGCCNPELFGARRENMVDPHQIATEVELARDEIGVEGLSLLGGEPLDQLEAITVLCRAVSAAGMGVLVFTGYTLAQARRLEGFDALWPFVDTLVDGPYRSDLPEPEDGRRYVGSSNQRLIHRSPRYADPARWRGYDHAEIRVTLGGRLSVHGHPRHVEQMTSWLGSTK